ncbi:MAG TPA: isochorismatase family cysteine hydrolase [Dehalococcoidia bacterium]
MTTTAIPDTEDSLQARGRAFLAYLDRFLESLPDEPLADVIERAGGAAHVAVVAVDVVNGFCVAGPLASERVGRIVAPIERLLRAAEAAGVCSFAVLRDSHSPTAPEFGQFGPHCIAGTAESLLVRELAELPFAGRFEDVPKNATSAWAGAEHFATWVRRQTQEQGVRTFVVVGDCTDLCVYQTAMPLKLAANARDEQWEVIVPADCVDTYDLPAPAAEQLGVMPHDGDLLHAVFLYHMTLNGVRVVRRLQG